MSFVRARQLALEGATGTTTPSERDAMAIEVDRLIDQLLTTANSAVGGRHLFGGTATDRPPFAVTAVDLMNRPLTISYQGSDTRATVPVGRGQPVDVLYQGDRVFQQPGQDGFAALVGLRDELRNAAGLTDAQQTQLLTARVQTITDAHEGILGAVGEMSASLEAIESMDYRLGDLRVRVKSHMGDLESADMAEVVVNLRTQESLFSSALQISARLFDQSLMDYLR